MFEPEIDTVADVTAAAESLFERSFREAVDARGSFLVNLTGGSTPMELYRRLATRHDLPWERCVAVWGDERYVPLEHPDSNGGRTMRALLDHVPVPREQVHPWPHLAGVEASAEAYAQTLDAVLEEASAFDLTLLGMGENAHIASLFPGTGAVLASGRTIALRPEGARHARLSMTVDTLNTSRVIAFLVAGERKRPALEQTLAGNGELDRYPARAIHAQQRLVLLTDVSGLSRG